MAYRQEPVPINLQELCGHKFKVFLEASWTCERPEDRAAAKPWSMELRGKYGIIYPKGETELVAYTDGTTMRQKLKKEGGFLPYQWGDYEATFIFTPDRLDEVAEFLGCRKRRVMSPEARERLFAVSKAFRFAKKTVEKATAGHEKGG